MQPFNEEPVKHSSSGIFQKDIKTLTKVGLEFKFMESLHHKIDILCKNMKVDIIFDRKPMACGKISFLKDEAVEMISGYNLFEFTFCIFRLD